MAKKKSNNATNNNTSVRQAALESVAPATQSILEPGGGSHRSGKRFIIIYGAPKARKTTSVSKLHGRRVKWLISDSNCIPTLEALGRMPAPSDIYEVRGLQDAKDFCVKILNAVEEHGVDKLGFDILVADSLTQFFDWHQEEVARVTTQRFMGENDKNNGWQQFNAEYGMFLDLLAQVAQYVTVIAIGHSKEKPNGKDWAGLNLSPAMAIKAGRIANWVLYQTMTSTSIGEPTDADMEGDLFTSVKKMSDGSAKVTEVVIHTTPQGPFIASVNAKNLEDQEPADMDYILVKEGLLEARE